MPKCVLYLHIFMINRIEMLAVCSVSRINIVIVSSVYHSILRSITYNMDNMYARFLFELRRKYEYLNANIYYA